MISLSTSPLPQPKRGEIWNVNLDPTIGDEIKKRRPVVVVNSDVVGVLKVKLVAPITSWEPRFEDKIWLVKVAPDANNGLASESAIDTLQIRGVAFERFINKIGTMSAHLMDEIAAAIAIVVEYE